MGDLHFLLFVYLYFPIFLRGTNITLVRRRLIFLLLKEHNNLCNIQLVFRRVQMSRLQDWKFLRDLSYEGLRWPNVLNHHLNSHF